MSNYKRFHNPSYKYVFFTIVTYNRNPILIENIELLRISFKYALSKYNFEVFAINVLKDHIHLLLKLNDNNDYSEIIRLIKYYFSTIKRREKGIWQRRYWEHTIKDENDLCKHLDYIHYNSYKHYEINPQNWEFSSFNKFVKMGYYEPNWCNFENKYSINNLNFE